VQGEIFVRAAKASNEVVFECVDGSFCSIVMMDMGWDQLVIHIFSYQEVLEGWDASLSKHCNLGHSPAAQSWVWAVL